LVAAELRALGESPKIEEGGVAWRGDATSLCRANLWLRTASRVVVRIARFRAEAFHELERHARRISWEQFVAPGGAVRFRVTCRKSRLYHSDAVAQRMAGAIEHRLGAASRYAAKDGPGDDETADTGTEQLFVVRLAHDQCTVSADSSGALLHLRGYRQAVAKAPLRETLAAALLAAAEWTGDTPLIDPLCGSGTIPIEAALIARRIPPGISRQFACLEWPGFPRVELARLLDAARAQMLPSSPVPIIGSDRDAGAISAARSNAERAGVTVDVQFSQHAISALVAPDSPSGLLAANPPYGMRVGERHEIRNLFAQLGHVARRHCPGWNLAIFSPDAKLTSQVGFPMRTVLRTRNGGIPVQIDVGRIEGDEPGGRVYF
jgi:putative N6-adenine-specific DNA methylase